MTRRQDCDQDIGSAEGRKRRTIQNRKKEQTRRPQVSERREQRLLAMPSLPLQQEIEHQGNIRTS